MVSKAPQKVFHEICLHVTLPSCSKFPRFSHSILISLYFLMLYSHSCCFSSGQHTGFLLFPFLPPGCMPPATRWLHYNHSGIIWRKQVSPLVPDIQTWCYRGKPEAARDSMRRLATGGILRMEEESLQHLGSQTGERKRHTPQRHFWSSWMSSWTQHFCWHFQYTAIIFNKLFLIYPVGDGIFFAT